MCGGRGTRLDAAVEKPLFEIGGVPMVDRVAAALADSRVDRTHAVVSPNAPETRAHVAGRLPTVETPGEGYVADLGVALDRVGRPAVTVAADLPLLGADAVDDALAAGDGSRTVAVPRALKTALGVATDYDREWVPTGLNVVADGTDRTLRSWDARLAVNVNRKSDAAAAERLVTHGP
jgi:adenosylcobinamide-phosphate guanylyltransferase